MPSGYHPLVDAEMAKARDAAGKILAASADPDDLKGTASVEGGLISVTVWPGGRVDTLKIESRAMRFGSDAISESILKAIRLAEADSREKTTEKFGAMTADLMDSARKTDVTGLIDKAMKDFGGKTGDIERTIDTLRRGYLQ